MCVYMWTKQKRKYECLCDTNVNFMFLFMQAWSNVAILTYFSHVHGRKASTISKWDTSPNESQLDCLSFLMCVFKLSYILLNMVLLGGCYYKYISISVEDLHNPIAFEFSKGNFKANLLRNLIHLMFSQV